MAPAAQPGSLGYASTFFRSSGGQRVHIRKSFGSSFSPVSRRQIGSPTNFRNTVGFSFKVVMMQPCDSYTSLINENSSCRRRSVALNLSTSSSHRRPGVLEGHRRKDRRPGRSKRAARLVDRGAADRQGRDMIVITWDADDDGPRRRRWQTLVTSAKPPKRNYVRYASKALCLPPREASQEVMA